MSIIQNFLQGINETLDKFLNFSNNIGQIVLNPMSIGTLLGCLIIFFILFKTKKVKLDAKILAKIGMVLALSVILHSLKLYRFPQGGSVTLGGMIPILVIGFIYGPYIGCLTGFLFGMINLIMDPFIMNPIQVLFDYPLPFLCLGLAGLFKNKKLLGASFAIFLKFVCHFISGVAFFGSFAPEGISPILYSLTVNGSVVFADGVICLIILYFLPVKRLSNTIFKKY